MASFAQSAVAIPAFLFSSFASPSFKSSLSLQNPNPNSKILHFRLRSSEIRALQPDEEESVNTTLLLHERKPEIEESVKVLKNAAKTRKVSPEEVLSALALIKKNKLDPSNFLSVLGGSESPGRTWMLIFTAQDRLQRGSYVPVTAVQRFDAAVFDLSGLREENVTYYLVEIMEESGAKKIENGVYLGPFGSLSFEGRFSWEKRILAFIFERIRVKIGPLGPFEISLGSVGEGREPGTKDPFFIWFYIDEEIAIAQGRGGGTAFWCRCRHVPTKSSDFI